MNLLKHQSMNISLQNTECLKLWMWYSSFIYATTTYVPEFGILQHENGLH